MLRWVFTVVSPCEQRVTKIVTTPWQRFFAPTRYVLARYNRFLFSDLRQQA